MINLTCPLICEHLFFYDFKSAYPRILSGLGLSFDGIDLNNKMERNIYIGKLQKDNPNISQYLLSTIDSLVDYYIYKNNITPDQVILRQRDGLIVTKKLDDVTSSMTLDFRGIIPLMIVTPDRKKILYQLDGETNVRGVVSYYEQLNYWYDQFFKFNFYNKNILFNQMKNIKKDVLSNTNKKLYMIPHTDGEFIIQTTVGPIVIKTENVFTHSDIDKQKYFDNFISEFIQTIYLLFY